MRLKMLLLPFNCWGHALNVGRTFFLVDADQISATYAHRWGQRGVIEVFGNAKAVRSWQQACAALGVSVASTVALPMREAADIDLVLRAGQLMALPKEERPERVYVVSADRRFLALTNRLCEAGIFSVAGMPPEVDESPESIAPPAFSLILAALSDGPVKAADIGTSLKGRGLKPPGKLTDFARKAGFRVFMHEDGFYWIDMAPS